ncbi:MAG: discoidin domain-containing protein [Spirochaetales bacterium]|nr:discoidin domain-containing protein [Spirochaetales bacterium]
MKKIVFLSFCFLLLFASCSSMQQKKTISRNGRLIINGQEIFLSGMNLAWIHFGRDLTDFDEDMFIKALDDLARVGGNCLRWWLHVNGAASPLYDDAGKILVLNPQATVNLKRALDLAWDRGILIVMCIWSFDMLQEQTGVDLVANKRMIEDPEHTQAYIDKALTPMVSALKDHPAIACWEIINEPEGMLSTSGWSSARTEMPHILRFLNLIAGGIHRVDPDALVTVGSGLQMQTTASGMVNYYSDESLIAAGGDKLGTLDFYQVHFYPEYADEMTSPFHHPASYWEFDKPVLIGEFPAKGIREIGKGFMPQTSLTSKESYLYAFENGYAGALGWTWTAHDGFGGVIDAAPGMEALFEKFKEYVAVDIGVNRPPLSLKNVENLIVDIGTETYDNYVNVYGLFRDFEDGQDLNYSIGEITNPDLLSAEIDAEGNVDFTFFPDKYGMTYVKIHAKDSAGDIGTARFIVMVYDPLRGNLALFKPATASTIEMESVKTPFINDGLTETRWSSIYKDDEWVYIDLGQVFTVGRFSLNWEVAYGLEYEIQVSFDKENWTTVYHEKKGDGKIDEITINPVEARYVRMYGIKRGTQWGFSLWEFEIYSAEE